MVHVIRAFAVCVRQHAEDAKALAGRIASQRRMTATSLLSAMWWVTNDGKPGQPG
jgi:hypothetical protein